MKITLVVLFCLFTGVSLFAQSSDFERGFIAGQNSCQNPVTEAWVCSIPPFGKAGYAGQTESGRTKAEAKLKLHPTLVEAARRENVAVFCYQP